MNNVAPTTLLHPVFNNLLQAVIFGRVAFQYDNKENCSCVWPLSCPFQVIVQRYTDPETRNLQQVLFLLRNCINSVKIRLHVTLYFTLAASC